MGRDFSFAGRSSDTKTPGADAPGFFWKGEIGGLLNRNVVNDGRTADGQPQALDAILNQYLSLIHIFLYENLPPDAYRELQSFVKYLREKYKF